MNEKVKSCSVAINRLFLPLTDDEIFMYDNSRENKVVDVLTKEFITMFSILFRRAFQNKDFLNLFLESALKIDSDYPDEGELFTIKISFRREKWDVDFTAETEVQP